MELYRTISKVPFKCSELPPKISMIADQNERYALKIKLDCALEKCLFCCVREFLESRKLRVTKNGDYLTISSFFS